MHAVAEIVRRRLATACHDIADGGCIIALAEMLLSHRKEPAMGITIDLDRIGIDIPIDHFLFTESGGFLIETEPENTMAVLDVLKQFGAIGQKIGEVTSSAKLVINYNKHMVLNADIKALLYDWLHGLKEVSL